MSDNGKITWKNERTKLSDLKPWPRNPRQIKKDQVERLKDSFDSFGQVETIAIGPDGEIYNGHQRLNVLMQQYGADYEVDVRRASRALSEKEREKLTTYLHKGATGEFNFDILSEWDIPDLVDWGWKPYELGIVGDPNDPNAEWEGMPEHISDEIRGNAFECIVRFLNGKDRTDFEKLLGYKLSHKGKTYSTWYPKSTLDQLGKGLEFRDES